MFQCIKRFLKMSFPYLFELLYRTKLDASEKFTRTILWDEIPYAQYAHCLYNGCLLAAKLNIPRVSAIEFGVAGGNGLLHLEKYIS